MLVLDALDYALDGAMASRAVELHGNGLSIDAMARALTKQFDLDVAHRTVVRWLDGIEFPPPKDAAAKMLERKRRAG